MDNLSLSLILATLVVGFALMILLLRKWLNQKSTIDPVITEWLKSTNEAVRGTSTDMAKVLQENTRQLNERLDNAAKVISDVQKNLGEMSEVGRGIKSLQEFLASPKLRGGLGEEILEQMIGQTFPKNAFHLQYSFKSGNKVDAVLKTDAGLLCIDSKFPTVKYDTPEFTTAVKKHLTDIARKYILPEEGTMDFALMYIPSEATYYEVVNSRELTKVARDLRVYPVSPNTLYAHLQVLLQSLQGKELETKSRQVFQLLRAIQKDYSKVEENMSVLGRHLNNAYNQMSNVSSSFNLMGQKLSQSEMLESGGEENI